MITIRGKVVVKEQQLPVPDVLVVAYEHTPPRSASAGPPAPTRPQPSSPASPGGGQVQVQPGVPSPATPAIPGIAPPPSSIPLPVVRVSLPLAGPAAAAPVPADAKKFWDSLQSERLGSVLTNAAGAFELQFEDGVRDVILFVIAPEEAQETVAAALDPTQRLLHQTGLVRTKPKSVESYLIRIPKARLEGLGIPYGAAAQRPMLDDGAPDPVAVLAAVDRHLQFDKAISTNAQYKSLLKDKRTAAVSRAVSGRGLVEKLMARGSTAGSMRVAASSEERVRFQAEAIDGALDRIRTGPPVVVPIDSQTAKLIESSPAQAGDALARERTRELDRLRVRSLLEACQARRLVQQIRASRGQQAPAPAPGTPPALIPSSDISREAAHGVVLAKVIGQLDDLQTPAISQRADPLQLQADLDALKLRGGPADVTSFHDFHTLQIAFRSVWQAVYDEALGAEATALYDDWVKVRKSLDLGEPTREQLDEFRSLRDFLRAVETDMSAARGLSDRTGLVLDWEGNLVPLPFPGLMTPFGTAPLSPPFASGLMGTPSFTHTSPSAPTVVGQAAASGGNATVLVRQPGPVLVAAPGPSVRRSDDPAAHRRRNGMTQRLNDAAMPPAGDPLVRLGRLMAGTEGRIREPYSFHVFSGMNFGLLTTYRQRWEPESYQVGELVSTMPLAPGEKRTFQVKHVVKKTRAEKEVENALSNLKTESTQTSRADSEIVRKATSSTNFKQTAEGSFSLGDFLDIGATTEYGDEQGHESEQRKKDFREAVNKAAEEYKRERTVEVAATIDDTLEKSSSGEISNPNTEISVTYLFYELQRRYRVSEQLYRVRPVILVAQDVPPPHEIDEDWLLAHEWILRRVLLDDGLRNALDYLKDALAGDELGVEVLRATWQRNFHVVEQISRQLEARSELRDQIRNRVIELLSKVQPDDSAAKAFTAISTGGLSLVMPGASESTSLEATRDAADRELQFTEAEFAEAESRARHAISALEASTDKFVTALRAQLNRRVAVDQLRVHVKENVLYYMQAIWAHEPTDQRFFRLYHVEVPWVELTPEAAPQVVRQAPPPAGARPVTSDLLRVLFKPTQEGAGVTFRPQFRRAPRTRQLIEVADLDRLLGFKGNYMIFPLKQSNPLIEYMLAPYRKDDVLGVLDPDDHGNYSTDELEQLLQWVEEDEAIDAAERERLVNLLCDRIVAARRDAETIVVPTGQLYLEALPGAHPVLEDFKLLHRALDVRKAKAEIRGLELENLRKADRLVAGERDDPDVEPQVVLTGVPNVSVT